MDGTDGGRIPTNLRTLLILELVGQGNAPMTAAEIGRALGLPKQTIHRLCNMLTEEGFLVQDTGGLRPGRRMRIMAMGALHASTSHIARHQILRRLAEEIGETVNFVVPEADGMSYKDRVETDWPFRVQLPVGSHVPFHCTASGKTYLASLRKRDRLRILEARALVPQTKNTTTDPDQLLSELRSISRKGYALDNEEFIEGMAAIAVPVRDHNGRYMASIGVHGPVQRYSAKTAESFAPVLAEAASDLAEVMMDA
ncbi:MAG: IclR family transcriptional regulator [Pseudomonadota bacterium]